MASPLIQLIMYGAQNEAIDKAVERERARVIGSCPPEWLALKKGREESERATKGTTDDNTENKPVIATEPTEPTNLLTRLNTDEGKQYLRTGPYTVPPYADRPSLPPLCVLL